MKRKLVLVLTALMLVTSLTACGKDKDTGKVISAGGADATQSGKDKDASKESSSDSSKSSESSTSQSSDEVKSTDSLIGGTWYVGNTDLYNFQLDGVFYGHISDVGGNVTGHYTFDEATNALVLEIEKPVEQDYTYKGEEEVTENIEVEPVNNIAKFEYTVSNTENKDEIKLTPTSGKEIVLKRVEESGNSEDITESSENKVETVEEVQENEQTEIDNALLEQGIDPVTGLPLEEVQNVQQEINNEEIIEEGIEENVE